MDFSVDKVWKLDELMPMFKQKLSQGESVCFYPRGTSMMPMLRQGIDAVVLSPLPEKLKKYDLPLYQRRKGQYVLHRILKVGDTYTCIGDNQYSYEPGVAHDQMIGVVTAFYRGEKLISVDSFSHKLYCRFWHHTRKLRGYYLAAKARIRKIFPKKTQT